MEQQEQARYEFKGKIGEGGRGAVYRAYDRQLNRQVAIKRLFTDDQAAQDSSESYQAIMTESHALSAISSPHIVRVFDIGTDEHGPYVVMEFLNGETLQDIVSRAPLVAKDFMTVAGQALEALIAAHSAKVLHRDIKPCNLMLTWLPSGRIQLKLLDFGLAKVTEASPPGHPRDESVLGSIYFMPPEQFERNPLDVRSDLYSLGCVLYYSLTGEYPFNGGNVPEVMAAHLQGHYEELQPLRPDLSPALCRWVERLMERRMEDRPATAQEALEEFEIARRATAPVNTMPVPTGPRLLTSINAQPESSPQEGAHHPGRRPTRTLLTTTTQIPLHTTSAVVVADPITRLVRTKSTSVPPWVFMVGGIMSILIVALGIATAMRGDSGKVSPAVSELPPEASAPPSAPPPGTPDSTPPKPVHPPPEDAPKAPPKKVLSPAEEFKQKDKNADFVLSMEEFVTARPGSQKEALEKRFAELDKNRDGSLTMSEFTNRGKSR